jgi:hypothetical protein
MKIKIFLPLFLAVVLTLLTACGPGLEPPGSVSTPGGSSGSDPCLQGSWVMSNENVNTLMLSLTTVPLSIPTGTLVMTFTGGDFGYASEDLTIRIDIPDGYLEAEAGFLFHGKFDTSGNSIEFSSTVYDVEAFTWRAVIDGMTEESVGPNAIAFPIPGNGPYLCSANTLSFNTVSGTGENVILTFTRQP